MPVAGDTLRYSVAVLDTAVLFNYQTAGSNQTWAFDSLIPLRQGLDEYVASSQTPYGFFAPNRVGYKIADTLALGVFDLINLYDFYQTSNSEYKTTHRGFTLGAFPFPIAQSFQDPDEIYQFPLNYQDYDSSTFRFRFSNSLAGIFYETSGYRINNADASGLMKTPYGNFNCLRVVTDIVSTDSINASGIAFGISRHMRDYKWLHPQSKYPIMQIRGTVLGGIFIPTTAQYKDSARNLPSLFSPIALFNADTTTVRVGDTLNINNLSISLFPSTSKWEILPNNYIHVNGSSLSSDSLTIVFTDSGSYDVQLIETNNEGSDTLLLQDYIKVVEPNGIVENQRFEELNLFPNPVQSNGTIHFNFKKATEIKHVSIQDLSGRIVEIIPINQKNTNHQIRLKSILNEGYYFLRAFGSQRNYASPIFILK